MRDGEPPRVCLVPKVGPGARRRRQKGPVGAPRATPDSHGWVDTGITYVLVPHEHRVQFIVKRKLLNDAVVGRPT